MKKVIYLLLAVCMILSIGTVVWAEAMDDPLSSGGTNISINATSMTLYVHGFTKKLTITVTGPGAASVGRPVWSSSNPDVATVNSQGTVAPVKAGSCRITALCGGRTFYCYVTVIDASSTNGDDTPGDTTIKPTGITLNSTSKTIVGKGSAGLTAYVTPNGAQYEGIEWSTSSTDTIMINGSNTGATIIAMGPGVATVTAKIKGTSLADTCRVTVQMCSLGRNLLEHTTVDKGYTYTETEHTQLFGCDKCGNTWKGKTTSHTLKEGICTVCGYGKDDDSDNSSGTKCGPNYRVDGHYPDYYTDLYKYSSKTYHEAYLKCDKCGTQWLALTETHTYTYDNNTVCRCGYGKDGNMHDLGNNHQILGNDAEVYPTAIKLNKTSTEIKIGEEVKLTADFVWKTEDKNKINQNKEVTWSSSKGRVATVDNAGNVKGISAGTTTITATTGNGMTATCTVEVKDSIETVIVMHQAEVTDLGSIVSGATWSGTNEYIKVTPDGKVTALKDVDVSSTVEGKIDGNVVAKVTIKIEKYYVHASATEIPVGGTCQLTTNANMAALGLKWKVMNSPTGTYEEYASVSTSGLVTGLKDGVAVVGIGTNNAVNVNGVKMSVAISNASIKVVDSTKPYKTVPASVVCHVGDTFTLDVVGVPDDVKSQLTWDVMDGKTYVRSLGNGNYQAIAAGAANVGTNSKTINNVFYAIPNCAVTVYESGETEIPPIDGRTFAITPNSAKLVAKETKQLSLQCTGGNIESDEKITWSSSNTSVASVNASGVVTGKAAGTTTISAKLNDRPVATCTIEVVADYAHLYTWTAPSNFNLEVDNPDYTSGTQNLKKSKQLEINGLRDGDKVTWNSSNTKVAKVENGLVTAVSESSTGAVITAYVNGNKVNTWTVKVEKYNPISIDFPSSVTIGVGSTPTLTANMAVKECDIVDIKCEHTDIIGCVKISENSCRVTAHKVGTSTITILFNCEGSYVSKTCAVTVKDDIMNSFGDNIKLSIQSPDASKVKEGAGVQLKVTAISGDKSISISELGTLKWKSLDGYAATVDNSGYVTFLRGGKSAVIQVETLNSSNTDQKLIAKISIPVKHTSEQIIEYKRDTAGSQFDRTMHYIRVYCPNCGYSVVEEEHKYESNGYCKCGKAKPSGGGNGGSKEPICTKLQPSGDNSIFVIGDKIKLIDYIKYEPDDAVLELEYSIPNGGLDSTLSVKLEKDEFGTLKFLSGYGKIKVKIKDKRSSLETELHFEVLKVEENSKPVEEKKFDDVNKNDWFYEDVMASFGDGIFNGVSNTEFSPNGTITRGMFITGLYRLDMTDEKIFNIFFNDVEDGMYYTEPITWATEHAIASGITNQEFQPNENITRAHMAKYIANYLRIRHPGLVEGTTKLQVEDFSDKAELPDWSVDAVKMLQELGLINGKGNNEYKPNDTLTRAEAATILNRVSNFVYTREGEHSPLRVE